MKAILAVYVVASLLFILGCGSDKDKDKANQEKGKSVDKQPVSIQEYQASKSPENQKTDSDKNTDAGDGKSNANDDEFGISNVLKGNSRLSGDSAIGLDNNDSE